MKTFILNYGTMDFNTFHRPACVKVFFLGMVK